MKQFIFCLLLLVAIPVLSAQAQAENDVQADDTTYSDTEPDDTAYVKTLKVPPGEKAPEGAEIYFNAPETSISVRRTPIRQDNNEYINMIVRRSLIMVNRDTLMFALGYLKERLITVLVSKKNKKGDYE